MIELPRSITQEPQKQVESPTFLPQVSEREKKKHVKHIWTFCSPFHFKFRDHLIQTRFAHSHTHSFFVAYKLLYIYRNF